MTPNPHFFKPQWNFHCSSVAVYLAPKKLCRTPDPGREEMATHGKRGSMHRITIAPPPFPLLAWLSDRRASLLHPGRSCPAVATGEKRLNSVSGTCNTKGLWVSGTSDIVWCR